jgi:hypothetical protein
MSNSSTIMITKQQLPLFKKEANVCCELISKITNCKQLNLKATITIFNLIISSNNVRFSVYIHGVLFYVGVHNKTCQDGRRDHANHQAKNRKRFLRQS